MVIIASFSPHTSKKLPQRTHITLQLPTWRTNAITAKKQWKKTKIFLRPALALLQLSSPAISYWSALFHCLLLHQGLHILLSDEFWRAAWERNALVFGSLKASGSFKPSELQPALTKIHYGRRVTVEISKYKSFPEVRHKKRVPKFIWGLIMKYLETVVSCVNSFFYMNLRGLEDVSASLENYYSVWK